MYDAALVRSCQFEARVFIGERSVKRRQSPQRRTWRCRGRRFRDLSIDFVFSRTTHDCQRETGSSRALDKLATRNISAGRIVGRIFQDFSLKDDGPLTWCLKESVAMAVTTN